LPTANESLMLHSLSCYKAGLSPRRTGRDRSGNWGETWGYRPRAGKNDLAAGGRGWYRTAAGVPGRHEVEAGQPERRHPAGSAARSSSGEGWHPPGEMRAIDCGICP